MEEGEFALLFSLSRSTFGHVRGDFLTCAMAVDNSQAL
jgi:hypothetical protein